MLRFIQRHTFLKYFLVMALVVSVALPGVFMPLQTVHAQAGVGAPSAPIEVKAIENSCDGGLLGGADSLFCGIAEIAAWLASLVAAVTGTLLDLAIELSVVDSSVLLTSGAVGTTWTVTRDIVNMVFIFILLYIGFRTILEGESFGTMRILTRVIVIGVLLNFSLFVTFFIIDVSNILALFFYNALTLDGQHGISHVFNHGLQIQNLFSSEAIESMTSDVPRGMAFLFSAGVFLVAAMVFLSGAIIFIARIIALVFVAALAPIAFAAYILPKTENHFYKWLNTLIRNAFVAPVYLFMVALVGIMIGSGGLLDSVFDFNRDSTESGMGAAIAVLTDESARETMRAASPGVSPLETAVKTLLAFILVAGLLTTITRVAKSWTAEASGSVTKYIGKATGGTLGATAWAGRRYGGRLGHRLAQSEYIRKKATEGSFIGRAVARGGLALGERAAKGNWDVRSAPVAGAGLRNIASSADLNIGQGTKYGGYEKEVLDKRATQLRAEADRLGFDKKEDARIGKDIEALQEKIDHPVKYNLDNNQVQKLKEDLRDKRKELDANKVARQKQFFGEIKDRRRIMAVGGERVQKKDASGKPMVDKSGKPIMEREGTIFGGISLNSVLRPTYFSDAEVRGAVGKAELAMQKKKGWANVEDFLKTEYGTGDNSGPDSSGSTSESSSSSSSAGGSGNRTNSGGTGSSSTAGNAGESPFS